MKSWLLCAGLCLLAGTVVGDEVSLENVKDPGPNQSEEGAADSFSMDKAVHFLDSASLQWTKQRKCFTCHTNFSYLIARPAVGDSLAHKQVRQALEKMVQERWKKEGPRWDAEVVMSAAVLALNDAATSGSLHPTSRIALDRMWEVQRDDGGFDWLKCDWPPMESDDHYGATMAALAIGAAPEAYRQNPQAQAGIKKLRSYFEKNPPPTLHHSAMLLWADSVLGNVVSEKERKTTIEKLLSLQKDNGGWGLATLGDWARADGSPQDQEASDGYGTGFVIYVLRQSGLPASHASIQKGLTWLKANQRQSGRWFTRSLHADSEHFITHAGTAFAVLALAECGTESGS